jgi:Membrane proteins related to metalloendopeptidases
MIKKISLFLAYILYLILYQLSPVCAESQINSMILPVGGAWEETSPFGYRFHPIDGEWKGHTGVDLAADAGTPVLAAAEGTVAYAGWISGYGNACIIDHGEGITTLYGHMLDGSPTVSPGDTIRQGVSIGYVGSTGNSTGPHLHFEVRVSGVPTNPAIFCSEIMAESGNGSQAMDGEEVPINFDASFDFAKPLRDVITAFGNACTQGFHIIRDVMKQFFMILITIDLAIGAMMKTIDTNEGGESLFKWLVYKMLFYGILMYFLLNWGDSVSNMSRDLFATLGALGVGSTEAQAAQAISDPTAIIQKGAQIIAPIFNELSKVHGVMDFAAKVELLVPCFVFGAILMIGFTLIGLQIGLAYIEFYMVTLFGFTSFVFSGSKQTRRYAAHGINGIFATSLKLMFFCMFSLMLQTTMQNITVDSLFSQQIPNKNIEKYSSGGNITSIDEFMARLRAVETGGYSDPYTTPSKDGLGYGAYQISYTNWDSWCEDAGIDDPPPLPWPAETQDRVARHKVEIYYDMYGNWHDVAVAWNGGGRAVGQGWSSTEEYWGKICGAKGSVIPVTIINFILLFKLTIVCLMFIFIGDRLAAQIMTHFGGDGFHFRNE